MIIFFLAGVAEATEPLSRYDAAWDDEPRPEDLGRTSWDDGTWSYDLPADFDPIVLVKGNLVTWRYDGQAKFSTNPQPKPDQLYVARPSLEVSLLESLQRHVRIDRLGRRWVVQDVDWAKLEVLYGGPLPETIEIGNPDMAPGEALSWRPLSWTHHNCDGQPGDDNHIWDGEGRTEINSPTGRQRAAVYVVTPGPNTCSGVLVRQKQVLTAAHCVSDSNNNPISTTGVKACRYQDNECRDADDIDLAGGYTGGATGGGSDPADDWAIIELGGSAWSPTAEVMNLSSQTNSELGDIDVVHELAQPNHVTTSCTFTTPPDLYHNAEDEPIASILTKRVKLKIDTSIGHSGAPLYSCPAGTSPLCEAGEAGSVFGVVSGYSSSGGGRVIGPKVPHHRADMLTFIND